MTAGLCIDDTITSVRKDMPDFYLQSQPGLKGSKWSGFMRPLSPLSESLLLLASRSSHYVLLRFVIASETCRHH